MNRKSALAVLGVFVLWSVLDFLIHGIFLEDLYHATAELWRAEAEMKLGLMNIVTLLHATAFVLVFVRLVNIQSVRTGVDFGMLWGVASGVTMGFGSYCWMPIPLVLAISWFLGALVQGIIAGLFTGAVFAEK